MRWQKQKPSTRTTGLRAEDQVLSFLIKQGLKPVTRNYNCRVGELDLVMWDGETLVFIEVRYRKNRHYGSAVETVDYRKQRKLARTALHFLQTRHDSRWPPCRFDVIGVDPADNQATSLHFDWIKNAFDLQ